MTKIGDRSTVHGQRSTVDDPLGTALGAVAIGASTGGALVCLVLFALWGMTRGPQSPFAGLIVTGAFSGLVAAVAIAWTLSRPLPAVKRVLACGMAMAGTMLVVLLTTLADTLLPRYGLLILAVLCVALIVVAHRLFHGAPERA